MEGGGQACPHGCQEEEAAQQGNEGDRAGLPEGVQGERGEQGCPEGLSERVQGERGDEGCSEGILAMLSTSLQFPQVSLT